MRSIRAGTGENFWPMVDQSGGPDACWPWMGKRDEHGYGRYSENGLTHREAYARTYGHIPDGLDMCHHCDNPPCCNPSHLFPGTAADNVRDASSKGRLKRDPAKFWGEKCASAKLTDDLVRQLRADYAAGEKPRALGIKYGVSHSQACNIIQRRCWRHI